MPKRKMEMDAKMLECPVCLNDDHSYTVNWYQCENGHAWCDRCNNHIKSKCPVCTVQINVTFKCLKMKQLVGSEMTSCNLCKETMTKEALVDHMKKCRSISVDKEYVERLRSQVTSRVNVITSP